MQKMYLLLKKIKIVTTLQYCIFSIPIHFLTRSIILNHISFSQSHKVGNVGIIDNFVFLYICSFLFHLQQMMSVNVKLEMKGYMRIIFQGFMLYCNTVVDFYLES